MTARCLACENGTEGTEDNIICLFTEEVVGTLEQLLVGDTPKSCPLRIQKANKTKFVHPASCKNSTDEDCFKKQYGKKKACLTCDRVTDCATSWSLSAWNVQKKRSYGRVEPDWEGDSWDNTIKIAEDI